MQRVYDENELRSALHQLKPGGRICYHSRDVGAPPALTSHERAMFELLHNLQRWRPIMLFIVKKKTPLGERQYYVVQGVDKQHKRRLEKALEGDIQTLKLAA